MASRAALFPMANLRITGPQMATQVSAMDSPAAMAIFQPQPKAICHLRQNLPRAAQEPSATFHSGLWTAWQMSC